MGIYVLVFRLSNDDLPDNFPWGVLVDIENDPW